MNLRTKFVFALLATISVIQSGASVWRLANPQIEPKLSRLVASGTMHLNFGDYSSALDIFHSAVVTDPNHELSTSKYRITEKIVDTSKRKLDVRDLTWNTDAPFYDKEFETILAFELIQEGKYSEAEKLFTDVVSANPGSSIAYYGIGLSNYLLGKISRAIYYYKKSIHLHPYIHRYHAGIGIALLAEGDLVQAETHLQTALELEPRNLKTKLALVLALFQIGNFPEASRYVNELVNDIMQPALNKRPINVSPWCLPVVVEVVDTKRCLSTLAEKTKYIGNLALLTVNRFKSSNE